MTTMKNWMTKLKERLWAASAERRALLARVDEAESRAVAAWARVEQLKGDLEQSEFSLAEARKGLASAIAAREPRRAVRQPARFCRTGGMAEEQIEQTLAGSATLPLMAAVVQLLDDAAISRMDIATEAPSERYSEARRAYDAGAVDALTAFKAQLAALTEARPQVEGRAA